MIPSCDQTGVPIHFHSSTTSGSASWMSRRIRPRVFPRQSPRAAIFWEMRADGDWPRLAPDFFMFSSYKFRIYFIWKTAEERHLKFQPDSATHLKTVSIIVIPAKAGIQDSKQLLKTALTDWTPAFAGVTAKIISLRTEIKI